MTNGYRLLRPFGAEPAVTGDENERHTSSCRKCDADLVVRNLGNLGKFYDILILYSDKVLVASKFPLFSAFSV